MDDCVQKGALEGKEENCSQEGHLSGSKTVGICINLWEKAPIFDLAPRGCYTKVQGREAKF